MTSPSSASGRIIEAVTAWPGVSAGPGPKNTIALMLGPRELGHLHGNATAHFGFPREQWTELMQQGRVVHHPIGLAGWAARRIRNEDDVRDVIELLRLNYDRLVADWGLPEPMAA